MLRNSFKQSCSIIMVILLILTPLTSYAALPVYINGYFDDWVDKPHIGLFWLNYDGSYDQSKCTSVSLIEKDGKLYGHVKIDEAEKKFVSNYMYFDINGKYRVQLQVQKKTNPPSRVENMPQGIHNLGLYVFRYGPVTFPMPTTKEEELPFFPHLTNINPIVYAGDAVLRVYNSWSNPVDEIEFVLDYEYFKKYCNNMPFKEIKTVDLYITAYGTQHFTLCGISTGPYIGIFISLSIVGLVLLISRYRLKHKFKQKENSV